MLMKSLAIVCFALVISTSAAEAADKVRMSISAVDVSFLTGGLAAAVLASFYQHLLDQVVVLALFIPVVLALAAPEGADVVAVDDALAHRELRMELREALASLEPEQRARGGGCDTVLAGAGLGDDPALSHPLGEQDLAERVVDLVRAGVEQVLALEVDRVAGGLGEPPRAVERRRAAGEVAQQRRQLGAEALVDARPDPRLLELGERGH